MIIISKDLIKKIYRDIQVKANKWTQGHVLIIGGSYGKMGSVYLSSKSALKCGCGLVTSFVPKCGYSILQTAVPEVMVLTDTHEKFITNIDYDFSPKAIGIGMGLQQNSNTEVALHQFLSTNKMELVIDADALNILSKNKEWIALLPINTILTPHKKELERLIGKWNSECEMVAKVVKFSLANNLIVIVKGAPTIVVNGENVYVNTTGNQALATAGSGDVLTGMITSFMAQGYSSIDAALLAVFLHGLTADIGVIEMGYHSFTATNIIDYLGKAFLKLNSFI
jgi:ADP-dependent NAD(P)H-hydrate dehydratase